MLVYTTLFGLKIPMFFIWLTYLKKHGNLGADDVVGVITDSKNFNYINCSEEFANIKGCKFRIEFSTYTPKNAMDGAAQKYKNPFPLQTMNVYLDLGCLIIKPFKVNTECDTLFVLPEGYMTDNDHGGFFLEGLAISLPGFSSACFAFTQGEQVKKFLEDVPKCVLENADSPLHTLDQPFYNHELFLRISGNEGPKICNSEVFFMNFHGDLNKMLAFMCDEFHTSSSGTSATRRGE